MDETEQDRIEDRKVNSISKWKDILEILKSVFIILGIIGGAVWFYEQGEVKPRAEISHEITYRNISKDYKWVHVLVNIKNIGRIPIRIEKGSVNVQRILPLNSEIENKLKSGTNIIDKKFFIVIWQNADKYNTIHNLQKPTMIEPGEVDKKYFEFIIPHNLITIKVYSYFENPARSWWYWIKYDPAGWKTVTIHNIK